LWFKAGHWGHYTLGAWMAESPAVRARVIAAYLEDRTREAYVRELLEEKAEKDSKSETAGRKPLAFDSSWSKFSANPDLVR
jgi:hypothetical protein